MTRAQKCIAWVVAILIFFVCPAIVTLWAFDDTVSQITAEKMGRVDADQ